MNTGRVTTVQSKSRGRTPMARIDFSERAEMVWVRASEFPVHPKVGDLFRCQFDSDGDFIMVLTRVTL